MSGKIDPVKQPDFSSNRTNKRSAAQSAECPMDTLYAIAKITLLLFSGALIVFFSYFALGKGLSILAFTTIFLIGYLIYNSKPKSKLWKTLKKIVKFLGLSKILSKIFKHKQKTKNNRSNATCPLTKLSGICERT